jgi:hypothetical protein
VPRRPSPPQRKLRSLLNEQGKQHNLRKQLHWQTSLPKQGRVTNPVTIARVSEPSRSRVLHHRKLLNTSLMHKPLANRTC